MYILTSCGSAVSKVEMKHFIFNIQSSIGMHFIVGYSAHSCKGVIVKMTLREKSKQLSGALMPN